MVDFAMDVFSSLYPDKEVPKELKDKRAAVVSELKSLQSAVVPYHDLGGSKCDGANSEFA